MPISVDELLSLTKTNMKNKGSGNVTGLKLENRTRTQSRTCSPNDQYTPGQLAVRDRYQI